MPRQATTSSHRTATANDNDGYQDEDTQGVWALERPGFRHPRPQQQQQRRSTARNSVSKSKSSTITRARDARAASVDSAFSVHRELYDDDDEEDEEEDDQGQGYAGRSMNVATGGLLHHPPSAGKPPVLSLSTFGRAPPTLPGGAPASMHKKTASTTTVPQKRARAYSDTDTRAQGSRKQTIVAGKSHHYHPRSRGNVREEARHRRKSDTGVHFKKPLGGLSAMNQDSQISIDVNHQHDDNDGDEMELDDDSEYEKDARGKGGHDHAAGTDGDGGAASSQEYENIGLQDLARVDRSAIHRPIVIEHTLSEQAEPLVNELEDAYANQWQDILSEKDSELYATANALGDIVLVDSLKVAEQVSNCGEAILNINGKVSKALYADTHSGIERMAKLVAKQKALVEKLNDNYARCKLREEKVFEDMQKIRDKTSATIDEANNIYVTSADSIDSKIENLVNAKNLQAQFNSHLLKVTTATAKTAGSAAAAAGGKKKGAAK